MPAPVSQVEILSALSVALDLVEGQPEGHAVRTAWLARRIAIELGLEERERADLHYACLLKDAGCSNNSARIHAIFGGDDHVSKQAVKLIDWTNTIESFKFAFSHSEPGGTLGAKLRRVASNVGNPAKVMDEVTMARCGRGAEIALQLGFGPEVANAVMNLDEHWDGRGSPRHRQGEEIPLSARIVCVAQTFEVFLTAMGPAEAFNMIRERSRRWFDPLVVAVMLSLESESDLWTEHSRLLHTQETSFEAPDDAWQEAPADVDQICFGFSRIVDAKSTYTGEHSIRVTQYSESIAHTLGWNKDRIGTLRRAALLHDIGKLSVPNSILDKSGPLNDTEFVRIKAHPQHSERIIGKIRGLAREAEIAGAHHERLDGYGYWQGRDSASIDVDMRVLAAADVFDALCARRPYRDPMSVPDAIRLMQKDVGSHLDGKCIEALDANYGQIEYLAA